MRIVLDAHLHLYPSHDPRRLVDALAANLRRLGGDVHAACFAERTDCHAFSDLREGRLTVPGWTVTPVGAGAAAALRLSAAAGGPPLWLFPGRQVATRERLEVLALFGDSAPADGRPAAETLAAVSASPALAVLNWAPGKWWFGRGRIVAGLARTAPAGTVWLGDTTLRPHGWPLPPLMRWQRRHGRGVLAGTDPLPLPGEEALAGSYACVVDGAFDPAAPAASLRALLRANPAAVASIGRRSSVLAMLRRQARLRECQESGVRSQESGVRRQKAGGR